MLLPILIFIWIITEATRNCGQYLVDLFTTTQCPLLYQFELDEYPDWQLRNLCKVCFHFNLIFLMIYAINSTICNTGCNFNGEMINNNVYADDMSLLPLSPKGLCRREICLCVK